ncbi:DUF5658 family protein [Metabacillus halosaccharovorans]
MNHLALFNLVDEILTYIGLTLNIIVEANPIMKSVYEWGSLFFFLLN